MTWRFVIFFICLQAWGAIAFVNDTVCSSSNSTTCAVAMDANPTAGNALIAYTHHSVVGAVTSVGGGCSATWTLAKAQGVNRQVEIWYCLNATGGSTTITTTWGAKGVNRCNYAEFSGVATSSAVDVTGSNSGTSLNPATGDITTANANDLLLATEYSGSNNDPTGPTNSFIEITGFGDHFNKYAYRIVSSTGTYNTDWTYTGINQNWDAVIVALKAAAAGGTVVKDVIRRGVIAAPR